MKADLVALGLATSDLDLRALDLDLRALEEARGSEPSGARARAVRRAGEGLGDRLRRGAVARRVEVLAIDRVPCPASVALDGALRGPLGWLTPEPLAWLTLERRMLYLELEIGGEVRRVLVDPVEPGGWRRTPWGAWFAESHPHRSKRLGTGRGVREALASIGVESSAIDLAIVTHLRGQDLRATIGTVRGDGLGGPRSSVLERAKWIVGAREWAAATDPHEDERPWLVRDGLDRVEPTTRLEGDLALGSGAALIATPGWTEGHATLFARTRDGVLAWTSQGVAVDCWSPYHSRLPGLRGRVRERDAECIPRGDAASRRDSLTWMGFERAVTDRVAERHLIAPSQLLGTRSVF